MVGGAGNSVRTVTPRCRLAVAALVVVAVTGGAGCADPVDLSEMRADVADLRTGIDDLAEQVHQVATHPPTTAAPLPSPPPTSLPTVTPPATSTTTSSTTVPVSATPLLRSPTPEDPLRVMVVGDSVTYEVEPALTAALQWTGRMTSANRTQVGFGLSRWPVYKWWEVWPPFLAEVRPEAVIIQTGIWDVNDVWDGDDRIPRPEDPDWEEQFAFLIRMAVDVLSDSGSSDRGSSDRGSSDRDAHVYWLTMLPSPDSEWPQRLNQLLAQVASEDDRLSIVDLTPGFTDAEGGYADEVTRDGDLWPTRKTDGVHLCREGAAVAAAIVAEAVLADAGMVPASGWEQGSWRSNPLYDVNPCEDPTQ